MPRYCEWRTNPDGSIMHFQYTDKPKCSVCGGPGDKLCDYPIDEWGRTCDKRLCERHAFHPLINGKPIFGEDKDYCPEHAPMIVGAE